MTSTPPIWRPKGPLTHIGSMDPADKRNDSHEGDGLSVSQCPESWEQIARLGGNPWWTLAREQPQFLDYRRLSKKARAEILAWGVSNAMCEPIVVYEVSWYDEESYDRRCFSIVDKKDATSEFEARRDEDEDGSEKVEMTTVSGHQLTAEAVRLVGRLRADPGETMQLVAVLWAERETSLDGVYWADRHEPENLSAPRAVIFPGKLTEWSVEPHPEQDPVSQPRDRQRG